MGFCWGTWTVRRTDAVVKRLALLLVAAAVLAANASTSSAADESLTAFLREANAQDLARDPTRRTSLDRTGAESSWTPLSDAFQEETVALHRERLAALKRTVK